MHIVRGLHPLPSPPLALTADYFKLGDGPWTLPQTVYKYVAIAYDIASAIKSIQPCTCQ